MADIEAIDHDVILDLAGVLHDHSRRRCVKSLLAWLGAHRRVVVGHLHLLFSADGTALMIGLLDFRHLGGLLLLELALALLGLGDLPSVVLKARRSRASM